MRIKNYFTIILLLCFFLQAKATGLSGDIISFNGDSWVFMAKPINMDSTLYNRLMDFIPDNHCVSTGNWEGYTAFWEIQNDYLCLQRIEVCVYDETSRKDSTLIYHAEALQAPFLPYYYENGSVEARWLNGEFRAGKGDLVRYVHSGFDRNMETECVLRIKNGKVINTTTYHNYKKPGLKIIDVQDEIIRKFPWNRFPKYKSQRITFVIRNFQLTNDGHFKDCDIRFILLRPIRETIEDGNHPLAIAFKETLKSIYPWEVLFINGKYTIEYTDFTMPIWRKYLTAHTTEPYLEVGVPVCYLNERGDTIVPYGKYRYCQTDTIKELGFVYENKPKDARIICINNAGKELFYVFKYDNGPDYIQEGLFRIMNEDGLVGFADSLGNVVIKPQFKFANPFENGKAKVTFSGENKEVPDSKGEKHYWDSSNWYYINKNDKIINK